MEAESRKDARGGKPSRGRGSRKRQKAALAETSSGTAGNAPQTAQDEDDEEFGSISSWNIPSWQELIGSLYRPDR